MGSPYMCPSVQVSSLISPCSECTPNAVAERTQALVVTALGNQRPEHVLRPKLDTIMDLAKDPNPVHG